MHPATLAPHIRSQTPKVLYISTNSPFISIVKRVQKLLSKSGSIPLTNTTLLSSGSNSDKENLLAIEALIAKGAAAAPKEEVTMKATGRAIEKLLQLAIWFQEQEGYDIFVRTGSIGAVDDVLGEDGDVEESRVRRTSVLEVGVCVR